MKKRLTLLFCVLVLISVTGCRRTTDDDIYGTTEETPVIEETTTDAVIEEEPQQTEETAEESATVEEEHSETGEEVTDDPTVSEDVYDNESATEAEDHEIIDVTVTSESVDDPEFQASLLTFLDPIYYNVFFGYGDYTEGITEDDMIKFAVSYVYQHEYNELKFDTTDFILYVPENRVEELVAKYFDLQLTRHHSFIDDNLMYEDGFYLMPAVDTGWAEKMSVTNVTPTGDFSYDVLIELITEGAPEEVAHYMASVEVRDSRFVLTGYVKTAEADTETDTEETTTAE